MSERTTGPWAILSKGSIYGLFQNVIARPGNRGAIVETYIRPKAGDRILDIGCGPSDILGLLPNVDYHGYDHNADYIDRAKERYNGRGHFHCADVAEVTENGSASSFDIALALGLLHHLNDDQVKALFGTVSKLLKPGGRLITVDPAITTPQSIIARLLAKNDRGEHVRYPDEYLALAESCFSVRHHIRTDLLRLPYTHFIMECSIR